MKRPLGEAEEEECTTLGFNTIIYRYTNYITLIGHHHKRKPQEYQTKGEEYRPLQGLYPV